MRLFGCKRMIRSHFAGGASEQGDMLFPIDGVRSVAHC